MRVANQQCQVYPGEIDNPDLTVQCPGDLFLAVHRGESNAALQLLLGRIKLKGDRKLFLTFPRILANTPGSSIFHRAVWHAKRAIRGLRERRAKNAKRSAS